MLFRILILLIISNSLLFSQEFIVKKYGRADGLPETGIYDIVQDTNGVMWFATKKGLLSYDGYEWKNVSEENKLPVDTYLRLKIDEKSNLWALPFLFGTSYLLKLENGEWQSIPIKIENSIIKDLITCFEVIDNGKPLVIIGTAASGLILYKNEKWNKIESSSELIGDSIFNVASMNNKFIISSNFGSVEVDTNGVVKRPGWSKSLPGKLVLNSFHYDYGKDQQLFLLGTSWLGYIKDGIYVNILENLAFHKQTVFEFFPLLCSKDKNIFFGEAYNIYTISLESERQQAKKLDKKTIPDGVISIFSDYEGNIWMSSLRELYKLNYSSFKNYFTADGLLENEVTAISQFNNGSFFFGHNIGITIHNGDDFKQIRFPQKGSRSLIQRVLDVTLPDSNNQIYFTSLKNGIGQINEKSQLKWIYSPGIFNYFSVKTVGEDSFLLGTDNQILQLMNREAKQLEGGFTARKILLTNENNIYVASTSGVIEIINGKCKAYNSNSPWANNVFSLYINEDTILVGTTSGLYYLGNDSLYKYYNGNFSIDDPVYFITQDSSDNFWFGTDFGVIKWDGKNHKRYTKSDGLSGNETNRAAGFVDNKGRLWIGTDEGLSVYIGDDYSISESKPKLKLLNFTDIKNNVFPIDSTVELESEQNNLIFHYRGLSFINEDEAVYHVRLVSMDDDWEEEFETPQNFVRFNNLASGDYIFSVRFKNAKKVWSDWKSSAIFHINRPFYQQLWFILLSVFSLSFVVITLHSIYSQRKYTKKLETEVANRTRSLRESQVALSKSKERYKGLIESQSELVTRLDHNGKFTFVNEAMRKMFERKNNTFKEMKFTDIVTRDDKDRVSETFEKLNIFPYRTEIEHRAKTPAGVKWFRWEFYAIRDEKDNINEIQAVGRDITIQRELEEELERRVDEKTAELNSLISQSPLSIITFDDKGVLTDLNNSAKYLFHLDEEKNKLKLSDIFPLSENEFTEYTTRLKDIVENGGMLVTKSILINRVINEYYKTLLTHWLIYRIYTVEDENKSLKNLVLLVDDVTEQHQVEEINKKLSEEKIRTLTFIRSRQEERKRISRDLHDGLGQLLSSAKLKLEVMDKAGDGKKKNVEEALDLILKAGSEMRNVLNDLQPKEIDDYGLIISLELLIENLKNDYTLNVDFSVINFEGFENRHKDVLLYRIIQEAFTNIVKHSKASSAKLKIERNNKLLNIEIIDDGIGISDESLGKLDSFGVENMKERCELLDGKFTFRSAPEQGVKIYMEIPV